MNDATNEWVKQAEWHGNPSLGFDSYMKYFKIPTTGRQVPVYVFGKYPNINFVVSAGANSDYSYSGCFYPETLTFDEAMKRVDEEYKANKLIK